MNKTPFLEEFMKKVVNILLILLMAGCGNQNDVNDAVINNDVKPDDITMNDAERIQTEMRFYEFDLDVDYDSGRDYELEFDGDRDLKMEASIEDELNDKHLNDEEAINEIVPILEKLTFTKDTKQEDVIKEILQAFQLPENYQKFDLEVEFSDHSKTDFRDSK